VDNRVVRVAIILSLAPTLGGCLQSMIAAHVNAQIAAATPAKQPPASTDPKDVALLDAVSKGDLAGAKAAINSGANLAARDKTGNAPLGIAASRGDVEIIKALLDAHAEVDLLQSAAGWTPLMSAAAAGQVESMKVLLANKANLRAAPPPGWQALAVAAMASGKVEAVKFLLASGADPKVTDSIGNTALLWAAGSARSPAEMVKGLQRAKALGLSGPQLEQPESAFQSPVQILETLVAAGADKNAVNSQGRNGLMMAAGQKGEPEVVKYFLAQGQDVNSRDKIGQTPLTLAVTRGDLDIVNVLIAAGADVEAETGGIQHSTPLIMAAAAGNLPAVQALVKAGAKVDKELKWETLFGGKLVAGSNKTMPPITAVDGMRRYKPGTKATCVANATSAADANGKVEVTTFLKSKGGTILSCSFADNLQYWCIDKDTKLDHF
jgi:ankyrin repeat protein